MTGFRINYNQVIRQADVINNLSDDLKREMDKLKNILNSIRGDWEGPASREFQKKLTVLIGNVENSKNSMSSVSRTIKNIAARIKQEDERQAEMASQLAAINAIK